MIAKKPLPQDAVASPGMSDAALRRKTGRGWEEWLEVIDAWGGATRTHPEIASWLMSEHGVEGWWAQSVTVGYERARGKRAMGQLVDGFSATASKTVNVPLERLYDAVADGRRRARWLPNAPLAVSSATPHKSVRGVWEERPSTRAAGAQGVRRRRAGEATAVASDGSAEGSGKRGVKRAPRASRISIELFAKGDDKSQLQVQHTRLRDAASAEALKTFWRERLAELKRLLESWSQNGH
ncbi:MAG TPA: SRPBCC domain-containing protein [Chloroflexota bacterium]|nr:SRPBCC domain-containing protein [Chloroflexota bacterium]